MLITYTTLTCVHLIQQIMDNHILKRVKYYGHKITAFSHLGDVILFTAVDESFG